MYSSQVELRWGIINAVTLVTRENRNITEVKVKVGTKLLFFWNECRSIDHIQKTMGENLDGAN